MASGQTSSGKSSDQHRRVSGKSKPGFLERIGETAGGALLGMALFSLSIYILFTNEGRAVQTSTSLDEGLAEVISLDSSFVLDPQNNDRLVHMSAQLHTLQPLYDPNYRVSMQAVKLRREVEMYQWVEYRESRDYEENGETKTESTYSYNTEWKSDLVKSRDFDNEMGHQNPTAMPVESVTVVAPEVRVGPFVLSKGLVEKINNFEALSLKDFPVVNLDIFLSIHEDYFYHSPYPLKPEVGDIRVRFSYAGLSGENYNLGPPQIVSIVAMQRGEQLARFKTRSGDYLEILYLDKLSAEELFEKEHESNILKTWGLRATGWIIMFVGIQLATRIVHTLVDSVPVLRELVCAGLKIFAFCASCSLSLLVVAAGWFFYRPLVSLALGVLAVLPVVLANTRLKPRKKE